MKGKSSSEVQEAYGCVLPEKDDSDRNLKTLLLDLDETLVHSFFSPVSHYDFKLVVPFEGALVTVYVLVRPHLKKFLEEVNKFYEIVYFTASIKSYAD